jgi:hypothetical protein
LRRAPQNALSRAAFVAPVEGPWLQELVDASGKVVALFSPPIGAREPRPLAVGLHAMGDHPRSACGEWRGTLGAYPFVLCPFGHRLAGLEAAVAALRARYREYLQLDAPLVGGFSLGAIMLPALAAGSSTYFAVAVMAEGYPRQGLGSAAWRAKGLRRLVLVNVQAANRDRGAAVERSLRGTEIAVRNVYLGASRHEFTPFVARSVRVGLTGWLADLPGWEGYESPPLDAP